MVQTGVALRVDGIGKRFRLGVTPGYRSLRESLAELGSRIVRRGRGREPGADWFWALRDLSFELAEGEVLGVIGRNGAGKSTLLKILSRITRPTEGRAEVFGRVGSLLEVGTGFHPELTGRENVHLYAAILGMTRLELARRFDEIVAFSEVERFLDTPVKHYSSGMYVRLAFAVAAHLEPEILLIDEVLAVGDAGFQRKCLDKAGDLASGGRTVLFVSHNMAAVERLCTSALLLEEGRIARFGRVEEVVQDYLAGVVPGATSWRRSEPASSDAWFESVRLDDAAGAGGPTLTTASTPRLTADFEIGKPMASLQLSVDVLGPSDEVLVSTIPQDGNVEMPLAPGRYRALLALPPEILMERRYGFRANLYVPCLGGLDRVDSLRVSVLPADSLATACPTERSGVLALRCGWTLEQIE